MGAGEKFMDDIEKNISRRKFMTLGSAAVASPFLLNLAGSVAEAAAAAKTAGKKGKIYYITDQCVGCHACKVFCPEKAIFFGERKMAIDQEKCVQCGTCYEECPICVISEVEI
jgi:uncharacterized Fe-S center protein